MTGCPNGCARPYVAEIGFVGRAPGVYNLYLGAGHSGMRFAFFALPEMGDTVNVKLYFLFIFCLYFVLIELNTTKKVRTCNEKFKSIQQVSASVSCTRLPSTKSRSLASSSPSSTHTRPARSPASPSGTTSSARAWWPKPPTGLTSGTTSQCRSKFRISNVSLV